MATELFNPDHSLQKIHNDLIDHLTEESWITFSGQNKMDFHISQNGEATHWFDDLVEVILKKLEKRDMEIIKFCIKKEINLFDIQVKKHTIHGK